jgi:uncharacterized protein YqeY
MSLIEKIRADQLASRKAAIKYPETNKLQADLLTTLLGEAVMVGKNAGSRETTDAEVVAIVKKFIKNIDDTLAHLNGGKTFPDFQLIGLKAERMVLENYLPRQLSEDDLIAIVKAHVESQPLSTMPILQKYLKENHAGTYDGKLATTVINTVLTTLS